MPRFPLPPLLPFLLQGGYVVFSILLAPAVWCGVVWCGVVWCGVVWCGVVWCECGSACVRRVRRTLRADLITQRQFFGRKCVCVHM